MGSVLRNFNAKSKQCLSNVQSMRGVVVSAQKNLGELRDEMTMGSYLPLTSFKFYPDQKRTYELKLR